MASRKWPRYRIARKDYIFALGVLAANFNELEEALYFNFSINVRIPQEAMSLLFKKSDNAQRIKIIQGCLSVTAYNKRDHTLPYNKREKDALRYFMQGFAICAENRNILLHAQVVSYGRQGRTIFHKESRKPPHEPNRYKLSISSLRAIADSMHAFSEYGADLASVLNDAYWRKEKLGWNNIRRPLPYRPKLPKHLALMPPGVPNLPRGR